MILSVLPNENQIIFLYSIGILNLFPFVICFYPVSFITQNKFQTMCRGLLDICLYFCPWNEVFAIRNQIGDYFLQLKALGLFVLQFLFWIL